RSGEGVQLAPAEHVVLAVRRLAEGVQADGDHGAEVDDQGDDLEDEIHEGTPISGEGKGESKGQGHGIARETPDPGRGPRGTGARRPWPGIGGRTVADGPPDGARGPGVGSTLRPDVAAHST